MINGSTVLALIPARGGSKGIVGKNIIDVGGRPMIAWTIEAAKKSKFIDRTIVSSDDPTITKVAKEFGCEVPFLRPPELSTDDASTADVVCHALRQIPLYDIVVLLQPTSPLRQADDIDGCLKHMLENSAESCVTVVEASQHPYLIYRIDSSGRLKPYASPEGQESLQRQKLPPAWVLNGAVYAFKARWFMENRCFINSTTIAFPMSIERSIDVDTKNDLDLVKSLINKNAH